MESDKISLKTEHIKNIIELCDDPKYIPNKQDVKNLGEEVLSLRTKITCLIYEYEEGRSKE